MIIRSILLSGLIGGLACCRPDANADSSPAVSESNDSIERQVDLSVSWPGNKKTIVLPMQFLDSLPVIGCKLNGKSAMMLIDTGADIPCLYDDVLEAYGIDDVGFEDIEAYGAHGVVNKTRWCGPYTMDVEGGMVISVSSAICLRATTRSPGLKVAGIVPGSLLRSLHGVIDLGRGELTLSQTVQSPE